MIGHTRTSPRPRPVRRLLLFLWLCLFMNTRTAEGVESCRTCHTSPEALRGASSSSAAIPLISPAFTGEDPHGRIPCSFCHGGNADAPQRDEAHAGLVRDPSADTAPASDHRPPFLSDIVDTVEDLPRTPCALCHLETMTAQDDDREGIIIRLDSDRPLGEQIADIERSRSMKSHGNCGDCHVAPRKSEDFHRFFRTAQSTCLSCHETPIGREYRGAGTGRVPDHHHSAAGLSCGDCHTSDTLHNGVMTRPSCASCHLSAENDHAPPPRHPAHDIHEGRLSCHVCHSTSCGRDFLIGLNPEPIAPIYVPRRQIPHNSTDSSLHRTISLPHRAAPHTIRRRTPQNASCTSCHGNDQLFAGIPAPELAAAELSCLTCHHASSRLDHFGGSVHGLNGCTSCHQPVHDLTTHLERHAPPDTRVCARCHPQVSTACLEDTHLRDAGLDCLFCHGEIHALAPRARDKQALVEACIRCHEEDCDLSLGHTAQILTGNTDAAGCIDCHEVHGIASFPDDPAGRALARTFFAGRCEGCHGDAQIVARNALNPRTVDRYRNTYHGKVYSLGYPERVAGCTDCHDAHNTLPPEDPRSALAPGDLINRCDCCHEDFHVRFASFVAHPDEHDRDRFTALFATRIFMQLLIVSVFLFFWLHCLLWWRKVYWDRARRRRAGLSDFSPPPREDDPHFVRRFTNLDRGMHLLLIISFFGLVISGFPLKYHQHRWARVALELLGGDLNAGFVHRTSATLMWGLFLIICVRVCRYLFTAQRPGDTWRERLFSEDSLFPNLKDLCDVRDMFRWLTGKGEPPRFTRWTYWEKFDFLAVFWGMFAIGFTGLMLWFPEASSHILPGWMVNVAAIAHSEEAILAAVFIFTVHFFNNHFLPGKFPGEMNIFTGRVTLEDLEQDHPREHERLTADPERLSRATCEGPGIITQLVTSLLSLTALGLGITLTILILGSEWHGPDAGPVAYALKLLRLISGG